MTIHIIFKNNIYFYIILLMPGLDYKVNDKTSARSVSGRLRQFAQVMRTGAQDITPEAFSSYNVIAADIDGLFTGYYSNGSALSDLQLIGTTQKLFANGAFNTFLPSTSIAKEGEIFKYEVVFRGISEAPGALGAIQTSERIIKAQYPVPDMTTSSGWTANNMSQVAALFEDIADNVDLIGA